MNVELINELAEGFTGREWVFDQIEAWFQRSSNRMMLLTGEPGAGKSAVAAELAKKSAQTRSAPGLGLCAIRAVAACHFCRERDDVSLSPRRFVESISGQLASRYPEFVAALPTESGSATAVTIEAQQDVGTVEQGSLVQNVVIGKIELASSVIAREAFDRLIREPLQRLYDGGRLREPLIIVVDSLDEALSYSGDIENTIVGVLSHSSLPPNVFFILTSRPNIRIPGPLGEFSIDLIRDAPDDLRDVERYSVARLDARGKGYSPIAKRIAEAAKGNFLYAKFVLDDLDRLPTLLRDFDQIALPEGLHDVYRWFVERDLRRDIDKWRRVYRPLLSLLAVSRGRGLGQKHLVATAGLRASELEDALAICLPYIGVDTLAGSLRPYHSSFRDYLLTDAEISLSAAEMNVALAMRLYNANQGRWPDCRDDYALHYCVRHLIDAVRMDDGRNDERIETYLAGIATDLDYLQVKIDRIGVDELISDIEGVVGLLPQDHPSRPEVVGIYHVLKRERHHLRMASESEMTKPPSLLRQTQYRATILAHPKLALRAWQQDGDDVRPRLRLVAASNAEDPTLVQVLPHSDVVMGVAASIDGKLAFSGDGAGLVKLWDVATGLSLWSSELRQARTEGLLSVAMSRDASRALSGYADGTIAVWDLATRQLARESSFRESPVFRLGMNSTGTRALSGFEDGFLVYWDVHTGVTLHSAKFSSPVTAMCLSGTGEYAIVGCRDGTVTGLSLPEGRHRFKVPLHFQQVQSVAFSKDESSVISCGQDGATLVFSSVTGLISTELPREANEYLYGARLSWDDAIAITSAEDNIVRLWDRGSRKLVYRFRGHSGGVVGLDLCGPSQVISSGGDQNVLLWNLDLARELWRRGAFVPSQGTPGHDNWVRAVSIAGDASIAASGAFDGKIILWEPETGRYIDTIGPLLGGIRSISLSRTGEYVLALCHVRRGSIAVVFDVASRAKVAQFGHLSLTAWAGALTADGRRAVGAREDATLCLWDTTTGKVSQTFKGHSGTVYCAVFGNSDETLLSGGGDSVAALWETASGSILHRFQGHTGPIWSVAVSRDGHLAATGSQDSSARIWDISTGETVTVLRGHGAPVMAVAFSRDGKYLISGSEDKTLILWDVGTGEAVDRLYLDSKVSCVAAKGNQVLVGDYGGALYFLDIAESRCVDAARNGLAEPRSAVSKHP